MVSLKLSSVVKIDPKGRVTIPLFIRESMDISEGRYMVLIADVDKKEMILTPITTKNEELYEIRVELQDKPGALADLTKAFLDMKLDILISKCSTIKRGEIGECTMIVEPGNKEIKPEDIEKKISELPVIYMVSVKPVEKNF
ncbi:MAG: AbrB family DNA-binding protein [Fervidicoccus fontis]|uniref:AbrB family DNA-binding protein n=1 Tax=Fervidicoccus fontis TaxID=683846 RepID=A0A2J6N440_9CREN|nr:MAG: AbrB family DNA-binding protein [Fervidicoccus fontis]PMB77692.1 MAG: AbrB family DNA-binding protein [Fervidicoccus fontis]HEW63556.1 AbrB family DNA-binding protein [Fervidicoccus fontis]